MALLASTVDAQEGVPQQRVFVSKAGAHPFDAPFLSFHFGNKVLVPLCSMAVIALAGYIFSRGKVFDPDDDGKEDVQSHATTRTIPLSNPLPQFMDDAFAILSGESIALQVEGLLRISAPKTSLDSIQAKLRNCCTAPLDGNAVSLSRFNNNQDIHVVGAIFKWFFDQLEEPLLTFDLSDELLDLRPTSYTVEIPKLLQRLPPTHATVLARLLDLLVLITEHKATKMGPNNLAVVFGPSLLKSRTSRSSEPMMMLADAPKANAIVEALIKLRAAGKLALTAGLAPTAGEKEQRSVHSEAGAIMQVASTERRRKVAAQAEEVQQ